MKCPKCGEKTKVRDITAAPEETYRKRQCGACGHIIYTVEYEIERDQNFRFQWAEHNRAYVKYRKGKGGSSKK